MGRGAQGQTQSLTDQQLNQTNALNQQLLGQQQLVQAQPNALIMHTAECQGCAEGLLDKAWGMVLV